MKPLKFNLKHIVMTPPPPPPQGGVFSSNNKYKSVEKEALRQLETRRRPSAARLRSSRKCGADHFTLKRAGRTRVQAKCGAPSERRVRHVDRVTRVLRPAAETTDHRCGGRFHPSSLCFPGNVTAAAAPRPAHGGFGQRFLKQVPLFTNVQPQISSVFAAPL